MNELKPCPFCKDIWLYVSDGDYYSGYESFGYRVGCRCGFAWKAITWQKTKEEAIEAWNRRVGQFGTQNHFKDGEKMDGKEDKENDGSN